MCQQCLEVGIQPSPPLQHLWWKPWPPLHTHTWRCWVAVNHISLNEGLVIFHTQLPLLGSLPCSFHLAPNWLQAWLALEFVQLHSTLAKELHRGAAAGPVAVQSSQPPAGEAGSHQPLLQQGNGDRDWCRGTKGTPGQLTPGTLELAALQYSFSHPVNTNSQTPNSGFDEPTFSEAI